MTEPQKPQDRTGPSRKRYREFVENYRNKRLDAIADAESGHQMLNDGAPEGNGASAGDGAPATLPAPERKARRRQYLREHLAWLRPYKYAVAFVFFLALLRAG